MAKAGGNTMKKLTTLLLTITLLFCACSTNVSQSDNGTGDRQYTIYSDVTDSEAKSQKVYKSVISSNIKLDNASNKDFSINKKIETRIPDTTKERSITIANKSFDMKLIRSYKTSISTSSMGKTNSIGQYDYYRFEGENGDNVEVEFTQETNRLTFFIVYGEKRTVESGNFTKELAKQEADSIIAELYGENSTSKYAYEETFENNSQSSKGFSVLYQRYLYGYKTDETILIKFNRSGDLISINAERIDTFNGADALFSKKDVQSAQNALLGTLHDSWTSISEPELTVGSDGNYYLSVFTARESSSDNTEPSTNIFYININ